MGRPKGMRKTGGRVAGTPNKVKSVQEVLDERGVNPAERLVDLATGDNDLKAHQKAAIWQTLLEYSQAKPTSVAEEKHDGPNPADHETTEELLKALSAPNEANHRAKDS